MIAEVIPAFLIDTWRQNEEFMFHILNAKESLVDVIRYLPNEIPVKKNLPTPAKERDTRHL